MWSMCSRELWFFLFFFYYLCKLLQIAYKASNLFKRRIPTFIIVYGNIIPGEVVRWMGHHSIPGDGFGALPQA